MSTGLHDDLAIDRALVLGYSPVLAVDTLGRTILDTVVAAADRAGAPLAVAPVCKVTRSNARFALRRSFQVVADVRRDMLRWCASTQGDLYAAVLDQQLTRTAVIRTLGFGVRDLLPLELAVGVATTSLLERTLVGRTVVIGHYLLALGAAAASESASRALTGPVARHPFTQDPGVAIQDAFGHQILVGDLRRINVAH